MTCAAPVARAEPSLRLIANIIWSQPDAWFGGYSGAEVTANGQDITLITDRGRLVTATMIRENGKLSAMQMQTQTPLADADGTQLKDGHTDAEGLAFNTRERAFVSFEGQHVVSRLDLQSARIFGGEQTPDFAELEFNSGLEALAIHPDGTLVTLPEQTGIRRTPFPVYALENKAWNIIHHIPRRGPFLPVGADFSDGGLFYLLERAATPLGFRSRIRRFDLATDDLNEETLMTTGPGQYDNLEALSIWRDKAGQTYLTLVSDDNFLAIQRTQIVEFILSE